MIQLPSYSPRLITYREGEKLPAQENAHVADQNHRGNHGDDIAHKDQDISRNYDGSANKWHDKGYGELDSLFIVHLGKERW